MSKYAINSQGELVQDYSEEWTQKVAESSTVFMTLVDMTDTGTFTVPVVNIKNGDMYEITVKKINKSDI